ncbi:hypothetical protein [Pseudobdellovibrio exovorus]|uniref:Asparagine synthetase domain-containing protein n=1 Tax=Pseudobdellovibrio exovorus JSS TaxID=1184267 RepID=M4VE39_9BACT|nr:hypothetical protein [Pseudobdellovibrio exovorus]AGH96760.1 hypothetical protein A11Q_2544 [Pseudobdellovibrio exovorus JSS]
MIDFEYFYKNHLKSVLEPDELHPHHHKIQIGKLERFPEKPFDEAVRAAQLIGERLRDPVLCLSGGLDSEAMALAFLAAKVPFRAAIMVFSNDLNLYDIQHALDFCSEHNVPLQKIEIDPVEFLKQEQHLSLSSKYRTLSAERALYIHFLSQVKGEPVLGGEILRFESPQDHVELACPKDRDFSYWRYFLATQRKGIPYFHYYTPELTFSFMAHTSVSKKEFYQTNWTAKHSEFYQNKLQIYREAGFSIVDRPARQQKWHGYEQLKISFDNQGGSTESYNQQYRHIYGPLPVYDLNQFFLIDENDSIARQIFKSSMAE